MFCCLGLSLERLESRARLSFDVKRAIEILLRAVELQLSLAPAAAVLSETRRFFDEHLAVTRLRSDDRLDPPLGDHRVHLPAEPGVRKDFEHVREPAACAVHAVLAFAGAVDAAADGDLGSWQIDRAVGVVEHHLDQRLGPRLLAVSAGEDHVLHGLSAHGQWRLLA